MSPGQPPDDLQGRSQFAPKWARDPADAGAPAPPDQTVTWQDDVEDAASDDFPLGPDGVVHFPRSLEPALKPHAWSSPRPGGEFNIIGGLVVAGLAAAAVTFITVSRFPQQTTASAGGKPAESISSPVPNSTQPEAASPAARRLVATPPSAPLDPDQPPGVAPAGAGQSSEPAATGSGTAAANTAPRAAAPPSPAIAPAPSEPVAATAQASATLPPSAGAASPQPDSSPQPEALRPAAAGATDAPPPAIAPRPLRRLDAGEIAALLKRGSDLITTGDLVGARLVFQRAAEAGDAGAAFALAGTYDPMVLEKLGERGLAADIATARFWYEKAKQLGSKEAPERLDMLASRSK